MACLHGSSLNFLVHSLLLLLSSSSFSSFLSFSSSFFVSSFFYFKNGNDTALVLMLEVLPLLSTSNFGSKVWFMKCQERSVLSSFILSPFMELLLSTTICMPTLKGQKLNGNFEILKNLCLILPKTK